MLIVALNWIVLVGHMVADKIKQRKAKAKIALLKQTHPEEKTKPQEIEFEHPEIVAKRYKRVKLDSFKSYDGRDTTAREFGPDREGVEGNNDFVVELRHSPAPLLSPRP